MESTHKNSYLCCCCICVCVHARTFMHTHAWRSEDNFGSFFLCLHGCMLKMGLRLPGLHGKHFIQWAISHGLTCKFCCSTSQPGLTVGALPLSHWVLAGLPSLLHRSIGFSFLQDFAIKMEFNSPHQTVGKGCTFQVLRSDELTSLSEVPLPLFSSRPSCSLECHELAVCQVQWACVYLVLTSVSGVGHSSTI